MCCLFGMIDYGRYFTGRQRSQMLSVLAAECEARGTDAAGLSYNSRSDLHVYKRPLPAHKLHIRLPNDARVIMGHTRMATQGSAKKNYNNHPFRGSAGGFPFALAHNGVLHNDFLLRKEQKLPKTKIETDSFVAVQLLEQQKALSFDSLKAMAEKVEGSFVFTVLDRQDNLYVVKGDNPFCLYHYPQIGVYLYASTEEILRMALREMHFPLEHSVRINVPCGDILKIAPDGSITKDEFDTSAFRCDWPMCWYPPYKKRYRSHGNAYEEYLNELKAAASSFGYDPDSIDDVLAHGYTLENIEEMLYCREL